MEKYLTTKELSKLIKMNPGSVRNLVYKNELKENIHFVRPTPRKILFVWSAIEAWLRGEEICLDNNPKSLINI